jgi:hypothetical protein
MNQRPRCSAASSEAPRPTADSMDRSVYALLAELNHSVGQAVSIFERLAEYPALQTEDFAMRRVYIREHLAKANIEVLHYLGEAEQAWMLAAYHERKTYEVELRDPDDCYFEVAKREKERHEQGLPSMVGVLLRGKQIVEPGKERAGSPGDESRSND